MYGDAYTSNTHNDSARIVNEYEMYRVEVKTHWPMMMKENMANDPRVPKLLNRTYDHTVITLPDTRVT